MERRKCLMKLNFEFNEKKKTKNKNNNQLLN